MKDEVCDRKMLTNTINNVNNGWYIVDKYNRGLTDDDLYDKFCEKYMSAVEELKTKNEDGVLFVSGSDPHNWKKKRRPIY